MIDYKYYVKSIIQTAAEAVVLDLADIRGNPVFHYRPGQYVMISYKNKFGKLERKHAFSLASTPTDKKSIKLGIKILGRFTRGLLNLKTGDVIYVSGPFGDFAFDENKHHDLVMIAGGIGITPFLSAIKYATDLKLPNKLSLLYSNKTLAQTLFFNEIQELEKNNENFRALFSLTGESAPPDLKNVMSGRLDEKAMKNFLSAVQGKTFFICGPAGFMQASKENLLKLGAFKSQIETEQFCMIISQDYRLALRNFSYAMGVSGALALFLFYQIYTSGQVSSALKGSQSSTNFFPSVEVAAAENNNLETPNPTTSVSGAPIKETVKNPSSNNASSNQATSKNNNTQVKSSSAPKPETYVSPAVSTQNVKSSAPASKIQPAAKSQPAPSVNKQTQPAPVTSASIPAEPATQSQTATPVSSTAVTNNTTPSASPAPTPVTTASVPVSTPSSSSVSTPSPSPTPVTSPTPAPVTSASTAAVSQPSSNTTIQTPSSTITSPAPTPTIRYRENDDD